MENHCRRGERKDDPFLLNYDANELRIASEFLSNWLPFLSRGLCRCCNETLSDRIRSLGTDDHAEPLKQDSSFPVSTQQNMDSNGCDDSQDNGNTDSLDSWREGGNVNDTADANSLGCLKDGVDGLSGYVAEVENEASTSETIGSFVTPVESPRLKMSWADMAQDDDLEAEEENEASIQQAANGNFVAEGTVVKEVKPKTQLSREQRERIRFINVKRKKDFICLERVNGKIVNILDGLELHTRVFSAAEQERIVQFVGVLQEKGKNGHLKGRTYTAPLKWMRGKGGATIQFGCCYNYAMDKSGNPPGILKNETVDPMPNLFKVMVKRLVRWHVISPSCVPDSCIVNIYDDGDCIPPHIYNHDFVRPFCTVSFLSECNIVFGLDLRVIGAGEFAGSNIRLPVGSVLVFNGNGADVAKHCVPAVPTKRISITFRRMDESKRPMGFVPEPDLQGLQPLSFEADRPRNSLKPRRFVRKQVGRREEREENIFGVRGSIERNSEPRRSNRSWQGAVYRQRSG